MFTVLYPVNDENMYGGTTYTAESDPLSTEADVQSFIDHQMSLDPYLMREDFDVLTANSLPG